eukprot:GFUD01136298.1.p1 GENE.GFUD01136298.1~~GFUD01136298.1.p1  ORF type:complete len:126 (-),score=11.03 GFUD01136298.1:66-443(-)
MMLPGIVLNSPSITSCLMLTSHTIACQHILWGDIHQVVQTPGRSTSKWHICYSFITTLAGVEREQLQARISIVTLIHSPSRHENKRYLTLQVNCPESIFLTACPCTSRSADIAWVTNYGACCSWF